jgi:predicted aldo/keto reductase-like oxidoreductase
MIYRTLAGEKVSQLGFGAMRLPTLSDGAIDENEAIRMIHHAIDSGVNYVDTAWVYHGGESETLVGKALKGGYRQKTFVATKSPVWAVHKPEDFQDFLDKQLTKLGVDCIDFYLLHALNAGTWDKCQKLGAIDFCQRMKKAGKIRHFGFSFHDQLPVFKEIVAAHDWEFCQIQYNYLDRNEQAGLEGLKLAHSKGIGLIIMEPLRGGNLVSPLPDKVQDLWKAAPKQRSSVEWALGWVFNHKEVGVVLSGMSTMQQLEQNLAIAGSVGPGTFTPAELALVDKTAELYRADTRIGCTGCRYCMPCPSGVDIPHNFKVWNEYYMFGKSAGARGAWNWIPADTRADKCTECGACLSLCPQHLAIPDELKNMVADFAP